MLYLSLRSTHLHNLFNDVWATLPPAQRAALERCPLVVLDDPLFLPPHAEPVLGAVFSVSVTKSIFVLALHPTHLPQHPAAFIKNLIADLLNSVPLAEPLPVPNAMASQTI